MRSLSEIFQKNARKSGMGRGQFDAGVNGLKNWIGFHFFMTQSEWVINGIQTSVCGLPISYVSDADEKH